MRHFWRSIACSSLPAGCISWSTGRAPTESVRRWQRRLHPVHSRIAGGCHLDRPIDDLITRSGLIISDLETGYGDGPRPFSYLYRGRARRGAEIWLINVAYLSISPAA